MKRLLQFIKNYGLLILWSLTVILMYHNHISNPRDPSLVGSETYGKNNPQDFQFMLLCASIEIIGLYGILKPWSTRAIGRRVLIAFGLWTPYVVLAMLSTLHAGDVIFVHFLWVLVVEIILLLSTIVCVGLWLNRRGAQSPKTPIHTSQKK